MVTRSRSVWLRLNGGRIRLSRYQRGNRLEGCCHKGKQPFEERATTGSIGECCLSGLDPRDSLPIVVFLFKVVLAEYDERFGERVATPG